MSNPHNWDPDPLDATALDESYDAGFEDGWDSTKPRPLAGLVAAAISGAIVGALLVALVALR